MRHGDGCDAEIVWHSCVLIGVILFVLACDAVFYGEVNNHGKAEAVDNAAG